MTIKILTSLLILTSILSAKVVSLHEAIDMGLKNSDTIKLSQLNRQISWQKYQQSLSALYPKLDIEASFLKLDDKRTFDFSSTINIQELSVPLEHALQLPAGSVPSSITNQTKIKLAGDEIFTASLKASYPIFTGWKISSIIKQADLDHQIQTIKSIHDTKDLKLRITKAFAQAWFMKNMKNITQNTYEKISETYNLAKSFLDAGSENVNKLDLLKTGFMSQSVSSLHEDFAAGYEMSVEYLNFILNSNEKLEPTLDKLDLNLTKDEINIVAQNAIKDNPTLKMANLATKVYEAKKDEANSEYYPFVGIKAEISRSEDNYDYGYFSDENKNSYNVGVGVKWNIFNGFLTNAKSEEARVQLQKSHLQKNLAKKALTLQYQNAKIAFFGKKRKLTKLQKAYETAKERVDLSELGYSQGLVKTKDLVEAQLHENFAKGLIFSTKKELLIQKAKLQYLKDEK